MPQPAPRRRRRRRQRQRQQQPSTAKARSSSASPVPSLPSLVRAALTCRAFLAAIRSPSTFRRRFRALHAPPFLGFFFESIGEDIPSFSPIRRRSDPDISAAVRGADVFLTRVPYHEDASPGWRIDECHGGHLLLLNWWTEQIAVYNPLTRALDFFPVPPDPDDISSGRHGKLYYLDFFLLYSDQRPGSFRVVASCHDKSRVRASVFSSDTREWQILPWSETAPAQPSGKKHCYLYKLGGAKDGELCMVSVDEFTLCTWFRRADDSGAEEDASQCDTVGGRDSSGY